MIVKPLKWKRISHSIDQVLSWMYLTPPKRFTKKDNYWQATITDINDQRRGMIIIERSKFPFIWIHISIALPRLTKHAYFFALTPKHAQNRITKKFQKLFGIEILKGKLTAFL